MEGETKIKFWILLALSNSSIENPMDLVDISSNQKPHRTQFDLPTIIKHLRDIEKKEYVKNNKSIKEAFFIMAKGKKELRKLMRKYPDEREELIKCFPNIELRKRVESIESFIFGAVLFVVSYWMLIDKVTQNRFLNWVLIAVLFFSLGFAGTAMLTIFTSVTEKLKISLLTRALDFLEDNKERIGIIIIVLVNVGGWFVLTTYLDFNNKQILGAIIIEILIGIWIKWKTIVDFFKKIKWVKD